MRTGIAYICADGKRTRIPHSEKRVALKRGETRKSKTRNKTSKKGLPIPSCRFPGIYGLDFITYAVQPAAWRVFPGVSEYLFNGLPVNTTCFCICHHRGTFDRLIYPY
jgi:hypothetical protein